MSQSGRSRTLSTKPTAPSRRVSVFAALGLIGAGAVLFAAWIDGGEEPVRTLTVAVPWPDPGEAKR